jgi:carbon monoxide dehydrogenase subunit G
MEFQNEFDVKAPINEVWDTMLDVERVAPCVPGAEVLERTGEDAYKVGIKVKVGPVSMQYRGEVEITDKDPSTHTATMTARAREARGQGTANANVKMSLSGDTDATHGSIATEVQLSGRAAAMGQGVIRDVSAKIVDQFAENLAQMLGGGGEGEAPAAPAPAPGAERGGQMAEGSSEAPAAASPPSAAQAQAAPETPGPSTPPTADFKPPASSSEGLDVVPIVKSIAAERLKDPRVVGIGIIALLLLLLRRRR